MTFYEWLEAQTQRDDPVGDLARDAMIPGGAPSRSRHSIRAWRHYLHDVGACQGAHDALEGAWREYRDEHSAAQPKDRPPADWEPSEAAGLLNGVVTLTTRDLAEMAAAEMELYRRLSRRALWAVANHDLAGLRRVASEHERWRRSGTHPEVRHG